MPEDEEARQGIPFTQFVCDGKRFICDDGRRLTSHSSTLAQDCSTSFVILRDNTYCLVHSGLQLVVSEGLKPRFLKVTSFIVEQEGVLAERPTRIRPPDRPVKKWARMDEVLGSAVAFKKPDFCECLGNIFSIWNYFPNLGKSSQTWEYFPKTGKYFPRLGKYFLLRENFKSNLYLGTCFPFWEYIPHLGRFSQSGNNFPNLGKFSIWEKFSNWENFPSLGTFFACSHAAIPFLQRLPKMLSSR
eukprot:g23013.t1